jgi:hypothetical protein
MAHCTCSLSHCPLDIYLQLAKGASKQVSKQAGLTSALWITDLVILNLSLSPLIGHLFCCRYRVIFNVHRYMTQDQHFGVGLGRLASVY